MVGCCTYLACDNYVVDGPGYCAHDDQDKQPHHPAHHSPAANLHAQVHGDTAGGSSSSSRFPAGGSIRFPAGGSSRVPTGCMNHRIALESALPLLITRATCTLRWSTWGKAALLLLLPTQDAALPRGTQHSAHDRGGPAQYGFVCPCCRCRCCHPPPARSRVVGVSTTDDASNNP